MTDLHELTTDNMEISSESIAAVVDALSGLGVQDIQMPASPLNVWNAIQQATGQQATGQQATGQQAQATNQENNA